MSFISGSSTAFGLYDADSQFVVDADRVVKWIAVKLGGGLPGSATQDQGHVSVELQETDVYVAFEEATTEYTSTVNAYQAKSSLAAWLGSSTGTLSGGENKYVQSSLEWARRQAQPYGEEGYVGGTRPLYSASIDLQAGMQNYDLQTLINPTGSDGRPVRIIPRQIHHYSPLAAFRFFGTTSAVNYLNSQFNFETFTPETIFYLLPIWEDVLRGQQFELSNRVRRSNYSYEIHDNVLKIMPAPQQSMKLWITYQLVADLDLSDRQSNGVANMSNIPFGLMPYSGLNSIARQWIWKMTLAFCKEVLGYIRRKMKNIPIPDGDLSLDGDDLVADAQREMEALRGDLRELLDSMSYDRLAAKEADQADALMRTLSLVPMKIFMG